jgi:SAM-dependent methyltransferase
MREILFCPICESDHLEVLLKRTATHPGKDLAANLDDLNYVRNYILFEKILKNSSSFEFTFLICHNCGLIFFDPRPEERDMVIKYAIMDELRDTELRDSQRGKPLYDDERARSICSSIRRLKKLDGLKIVDWGGASGYNLKYFVAGNTCYIIDYGERDLIGGLSYLCKTINDVPDRIKFDVVLCCHTLEHMVDPVAELRSIRRVMSQGGLLYVEVPLGCHDEYMNTDNFLTHVNFFSEGSLAHLFSASGLKLRYIRTKLTTVRWFRWLSIVAIAENVPSEEASSNGYELTRRQMSNPFYSLYKYLGFQRARFDGFTRHLVSRFNPEHLKKE